MIVNQTNASAAARGFKAIFVKFFSTVVETLFYPKICQTVTTNAGSVEYNWLAAIPGMKELKGAAEKVGLELITWVITNKKWHDTVEVDEADMETDNLGLYNQRFEMLADAGARHPDELAAQALLSGFVEKDYTGTPFFHTAKKHFPGTKGTFSNKLVAALDAASYEEAREIIKTAKIAFPDGTETKLKLGKQLCLIVGPALETTALRILNADLIDEGGVAVSNVNKGTAKLEVWSELGDSTAWFLVDIGNPLKPLVYQVNKPVTLNSVTNPTDSYVLLHHKFLHQAFGRYQVGYFLPQLIVGSTGAE